MPPTTAADGSGVSAAAVTSSQQQAGNGGGSRSSSLTQAVSPEARRAIITASIRGIPDFPKPGILFWDVTTLLLNPAAFQHTIDAFYERYKDQRVDVVAGVCVCVCVRVVCTARYCSVFCCGLCINTDQRGCIGTATSPAVGTVSRCVAPPTWPPGRHAETRTHS
jgi:hypothetical protein